MSARLCALLVTSLGLAGLPAQGPFTVTSLADSGPGTLRDVIVAVNASTQTTATINIAVGGTVTLTSGDLHPLGAGRAVTVAQTSALPRLVIDLRGITMSRVGQGFALLGDRSVVTAPIRVLINRGVGLLVEGDNVSIDDFEVQGGDRQGVLADRANDLVLRRVAVTGAAQGLLVTNCQRTRLAVGSGLVTVTDCSQQGLVISGGADNAVGSFVCDRNQVGLLAITTNNVSLGNAGSASFARGNTVHGVMLTTVNNSGSVAVRNVGVSSNGQFGLLVENCTALMARDIDADGNTRGGVGLGSGSRQVTIGPNVVGRNSLGSSAIPAPGLGISDARDVVVVDSTFGPGNGVGVSVNGGGGARPTNVHLRRIGVSGNSRGLELVNADQVTVEDSTAETNFGAGVEIQRCNGVTLQRVLVRANADFGLSVGDTNSLRIGPGNRIDDNLHHGAFFARCPAMEFFDNPSIARNRGAGVEVREGRGAIVRHSTFAGNSGVNLWILEGADDSVVGPGIVVRDALGTGIRVESAGNVLVQGCTVFGCTTSGIDILTDLPVASCRIQSCLVVDNPGIGIRVRHSPTLLCQASTIANNYIGMHVSNAYQGNPTRCEVDSCVFWRNTFYDHLHTSSGMVDARNSFFRVPAPSGNNNRSDDPQLIDANVGDYRLRASSPARDSGNQAISFPGGAVDAYGQPRVVGGRVDCGAYEFPATQQRLTLSNNRMPRGGGEVPFHILYPPADAGAFSILLCEFGPPSGSFVLFGATVPLGLTPFVLFVATDPINVGALAVVPASGAVNGRIQWTGRVPPALANLTISLCAVSLAGVTRTVSNVATFDVR